MPAGRVVVGLNFTLVEGPHGIGLAQTPDRGSAGCCAAPDAGTRAGRSLAELAGLVRSWNPFELALGIAACNAHYNRADLDAGDANGLDVLAGYDDTVVVGSFPGIAARLPGARVIDFAPASGEYPAVAAEWLLPAAEAAVITSSALANRSLPGLLALAADARVALVGPGAPLTLPPVRLRHRGPVRRGGDRRRGAAAHRRRGRRRPRRPAVLPAGDAAAGRRMISVLINAVHAKSGGGVTYLRNLLPLLAARGDLSLALVIQEDQRGLFDGLPIHVLPSRSPLVTVLVQEQVTVPRLARRLGADVVFSPANYGPLRGVASVIMLRNSFDVAALETRLSKRLYWLAVKLLSWASFRTCRRAITVSAHAGAGFRAALGIGADPRIIVVPHGVSPLFHPPVSGGGRLRHRLLAVSDLWTSRRRLETAIAPPPA